MPYIDPVKWALDHVNPKLGIVQRKAERAKYWVFPQLNLCDLPWETGNYIFMCTTEVLSRFNDKFY